MRGRRQLRYGVLLVACLCFPGRVTAGASVTSPPSFEPPAPTTGDPVTLSVTVGLSEECSWATAASITFGVQEELGPSDGWGIDLDLTSTVEMCPLEDVSLEIRESLGVLPLASGPGVLRLYVDGSLEDTAPFNLATSAGPAPGWRQPALHGGFKLFVSGDSLTAVGDLLAMGDNGFRQEVFFFDPRTREETGGFPYPEFGTLRALTFDGTDLFASLVQSTGPRLYRFALNGAPLDWFASPTAPLPLEGLAARDGILYGTLPSPPRLYAIDPVSHATLWHRALPASILGLTSVPEGLLGIERTGQFYLIDPAPAGSDRLVADWADTGTTGAVAFAALAYDGFGLFAVDGDSDLQFIRTLALWWARDGSLHAYLPVGASTIDVVRGDLGSFVQLSANVGLGPTVCVMADGAGGVVADPGEPAPGEGFFYLTRFREPGGFQFSYGRSFHGPSLNLALRRIDTGAACP